MPNDNEFSNNPIKDEVDSDFGYLSRPDRIGITPYLGNLRFDNEEGILFHPELTEFFERMQIALVDSQPDFEDFLKKKSQRPVYDIYACFQPFNEAVKSIYPFIKPLRRGLKPNDRILCLWDRTGWMTTLLAGLFPKQRIVSTWEGNKDVLGYKGFRYWFANQPMVNIVFCDHDARLPFDDGEMAACVGLDVLHRFKQANLLRELIRVVRPDGPFLFPHVHLSNSEPVPYFDRGCTQLHGQQYDGFFKESERVTGRRGFVFSEPGLFEANDIQRNQSIPLASTPDMVDYNALIALLPPSWNDERLEAWSMKDLDAPTDSFVVVNQLLFCNPLTQRLELDRDRLAGAVGKLLDRHPVFARWMERADGIPLSDRMLQTLFLAQRGYRIGAISDRLTIPLDQLIDELADLENRGAIQVLPISYDGYRLQHALATQQFIPSMERQNLQSLWQESTEKYTGNLLIASLGDECEFTFGDCREIVQKLASRMQESGLRKGDCVLIDGSCHTEAMLTFWAAMQVGVVVVPVAENLPPTALAHVFDLAEPKWVFAAQSVSERINAMVGNVPVCIFDEDESVELPNGQIYLARWLDEAQQEIAESVLVSSDDPAVVLFTSGTTGLAKGVQLSHGALYRSGRLMVDTFGWNSNDRFFALGGLEYMSGLRNAVVAPLHSGGCTVLPAEESRDNPLSIAESIFESGATLLATNPSLLRQFVLYADRLGGYLSNLKTVLCTGSRLSNKLKHDFHQRFSLPIYNYYGLTETAGICLAENPTDWSCDSESIGIALGCLAQIVDECGRPVPNGQEGELRIFSDNLMQGYLKQDEITRTFLREGWLYTQDLAHLTAEGQIRLVGRRREIIKAASGEVIYLQEIEQFLKTLPDVSDATVQPYIEQETEMIVAYVVPSCAQDAQEFLKDIRREITEQLGRSKVPSVIRIVSEIAYSSSGKAIQHERN